MDNTISEAELTDFARNNVIKQMNIIQSGKKKYQIIVTLTWKEGEWHLVTARGKPREWASLDRLACHIREKYNGDLSPINLTLINTNH